LREAVGDEHEHPYLLHDRDSIFSKHLDGSIKALGLEGVTVTGGQSEGELDLRAGDRNDTARMP